VSEVEPITTVLPAGRISSASEHGGLGEALAGSPIGDPEFVVQPESEEEVAALLRWASAEGVGVLPACSGRHVSLSCEARDHPRWVVLCTDRLSGIEIYEAADLTVTAGAGTPVSVVDAALRENRQWAPFDPPHFLARSLGGLAADAAHGPLWMGYGELRNHVLGMTVVTGDGRILRLGGRVVKNVAGFDLLKPMTGSSGSLSVITSVTIRAFPEPAEDRVLSLSASSVDELFDDASRVGTAPVLPVSCVVTGSASQGTAGAAEARMFVRLHGALVTVDADQRTLEAHLGTSLDRIAPEDRRALMGDVSDRGSESPVCVEVSVLPSRLRRLWSALEAVEPIEFAIDSYAGFARVGLAGVTVPALSALTDATEELGGALRVTRAHVPELRRHGSRPSSDEARLIAGLQDAFDPEGVFWPARR